MFAIAGEPVTLDPGKTSGSYENRITPALFEGLTSCHPRTLEPMAALATHYEVNADNTEFTFYLRGHPNPRGHKLPNTDTLRGEYLAGTHTEDLSWGRAAPPDRIPARWSDGAVITANDFIYSWRRVLDPQTAAPMANDLFYVKHGQAIAAGRRPPEDLAWDATATPPM